MDQKALEHLNIALRMTETIKNAALNGKIIQKEQLQQAMKLVAKELELANSSIAS